MSRHERTAPTILEDLPEPGDKPKHLPFSVVLAGLGVAVARGGNQVAIKFALTSLPPLWAAFGRMAASVGVVAALGGLEGTSFRLATGERRSLALLGAIFTIQIAMLHIGADFTSPAYAVVLINTHPIFSNLISHFVVPEDRLTWSRLLGLALAFGGVCVVFLGEPTAELAPYPFWGNLIITLSGFLVGARTVYIQRVVQRMEPSKAIFWQMLISVPFFASAGWLLDGFELRGPFLWAPATAIAYQGVIVGGVALLAWVHLLKAYSPGRISVLSFATPMAGLVLSAWLFGEALSLDLVFGLAAVLTGIALASRSAPTGADPS